MISIYDSIKLSSLKYKAYKFRSALTIFSLSIGSIAVLSVLFALSGITNLVKQSFHDNLSGKYYIDININPQCTSVLSCTDYSFDQKAFVRKYAKYDFKEFIPQYTSDKLVKLDNDIGSSITPYSLKTTSDEWVSDVLLQGESWTTKSDSIPIIVPEEMINKDYLFAQQYTDKQRFEMYTNLFKEFKGKEFYLSVVNTNSTNQYISPIESGDRNNATSKSEYKKTNIKVRIVGIITQNQSIGPRQLSTNFYIPMDALETNKEIVKTFAMNIKDYQVSMASQKERDDFMDSYYGISSYTYSSSNMSGSIVDTVSNPVDSGNNYFITKLESSYQAFSTIIGIITNIIFGISAFLLIVSGLFLFTTLNKIASDSKKEVAIFRSYGATKVDIITIFSSYVISLIAFGILLGLSIASILTSIASILWGDDTFYKIVNAGSNFDISKPIFLFTNYPVLYMLGFIVLSFFIGLLASFLPIFKASRIQPILALRDE